MKKAEIQIDRAYKKGEVDPRICGSFLEHLGRAVYEGIYWPNNPNSDSEGFRMDAAALVRELGIPIVRYPGGNFLSAFCWEDSVGPRSERPRRADVAWQTIETNEFGLNEFMRWCAKVQTEPMMAVNLGTRGIEEARQLLEYCNFPGGTLFSDMRRRHGIERPYGIKTWCLGNEMDGPWQMGHKSPEEYGHLASQTAQIMKALDPSIEVVACGSSTYTMSTFGTWEYKVLRECYDDVDYLSLHAYYGKFTGDSKDFMGSSMEMDAFIEDVVSICDAVRAIQKSKKIMNLSFDEWNVNYHFRMQAAKPEQWKEWFETSRTFDEFYKKFRPHVAAHMPGPWSMHPIRLEDIYTLEDAVVFGSLLISLLKHADRVKIACQAQLVNVIAPIMVSETGAWRQTIFYPYMQVAQYGKGTVLLPIITSPSFESAYYGEVPSVDAVALEDGDRIVIFAVNKNMEEDIQLSCNIRQWVTRPSIQHTVLYHEDPLAFNSELEPDRVKPYLSSEYQWNDGILSVNLKKHSWNMIEIDMTTLTD